MPDAVLPGPRKRKAEFGALAREELVRNLDQDSRAVAGRGITATGATMREIDENLQTLADDIVRFSPEDCDEPDPAGVMLVAGVIETLCWRQAVLRVERRRHGLHLESVFSLSQNRSVCPLASSGVAHSGSEKGNTLTFL